MIKTTIWRQVVIAALLAGGSFTVAANPPPPPVSYGVEEDVFHPVRARQGMVASVDALATRVGVDILRQGGNAVDAAVAVGYALAVTHPQAGNIGGGGFMMLRTKDGKTTANDFREMAPEQATRDMFIADKGNPDSKKSLTSHLASGTQGSVANAYISRVALYAANAADASAKGLYSDDAEGLFKFEKNANHYYELAYNAAKGLIGKYSLEPNYEDLFTKTESHTSVESIWPVMFKENQRSGFNPTAKNGPDGNYYGATEDATYSYGRRSGLFPTQDLVDCYLQKDDADGKWKNWWETSQAKAMGIHRNAEGELEGESANYRDMFKNRDSRFYSTVTYDGAYMGPEEERYIIQTWIDNTTLDEKTLKYSALHSGYRVMENLNSAPINRASAQTITGYYSRKYSQFNKINTDGTLDFDTQRQTCYFNVRYAEVLLNCAEASIKLGKTDAAGYINEIRNRAGLPNYDGNDLWNEMKLQRRLEFAFECPGFRYFDLLRWGEAEGKTTIEELNTPSRGLWIFRKGMESEKAGENGYPVEPGGEGYFTPKFQTFEMPYSYYERKFDDARYYFVPFSQSMLRDYTQLQQNPGWKNFNYNN